MRPSRYWILFACCASGWLIVALLVAPSISGVDVFIFRDAGWNLAAWGSFESAAGPYAHDLAPRFYADYTPILPLLFAGYASVFPRNAYAGTVFNLFLGLSAAAVALWWVLRQPPGRLRDIAAWVVTLLENGRRRWTGSHREIWSGCSASRCRAGPSRVRRSRELPPVRVRVDVCS
jgi:hypothetical protein